MADIKTTARNTATLPKDVFNVDVNNHELLQRAYQAYLANGRENPAQVKTRGLVRGGGKKPWRQKGTGRARVGSSRNPIWRGGGIVFGPTGFENHSKTLPTAQKRQAIRQALTLANQSKKISQIEFVIKDGKASEVATFIQKNKLERKILMVVDQKTDIVDRATRNVPNLKVVQATYLNVFDILNADTIVMTKKAVEAVQTWLTPVAKKDGGKR